MTIQLLFRKLLRRVRRCVWRGLVAFPNRTPRLYSFRLPGGGVFHYPLHSAIGESLFSGSFEPAEVTFVLEHLRPGQVVLDVGANAGLYTVLAAQAVGDTGHVYAFEPDARALALLRKNIAANELRNVTVIEAAASNVTGMASFAMASDTALSSLASIGRSDQQIEQWQSVATLRLDDAVQRYGIPAVSFVKMDVEGAEKLVLDGCPDLLASVAPPFTMLFEAWEQNARGFGYTVREFLDSLQSKGFSIDGFDSTLRLRPIAQFGPELGTTVYNFVAYKK